MKDLVEPSSSGSLREEPWCVVVIYEDKPSRDHAMAVCDHLVGKFWTEVEFTFRWWRMDFLTDPDLARVAGDDAAKADIILFSSAAETDLTTPMAQWFSHLVNSRNRREGVLLDLTHAPGAASAQRLRKQASLRELASRAGLDYLAEASSAFGGPLPDSIESAQARATQMSSVLEAMLKSPPPPPHFGLND
ncbi:MAG: hypothetical protein EXS35_15440 [Pedosphaera sp.]|nr:hypothetical protein [Pedosphaera sp.]